MLKFNLWMFKIVYLIFIEKYIGITNPFELPTPGLELSLGLSISLPKPITLGYLTRAFIFPQRQNRGHSS